MGVSGCSTGTAHGSNSVIGNDLNNARQQRTTVVAVNERYIMAVRHTRRRTCGTMNGTRTLDQTASSISRYAHLWTISGAAYLTRRLPRWWETMTGYDSTTGKHGAIATIQTCFSSVFAHRDVSRGCDIDSCGVQYRLPLYHRTTKIRIT
jgi:hypothetical protein